MPRSFLLRFPAIPGLLPAFFVQVAGENCPLKAIYVTPLYS